MRFTSCRLRFTLKWHPKRMTDRWRSSWRHLSRCSIYLKNSKVYLTPSKVGLLHLHLNHQRMRYKRLMQQLKRRQRRKKWKNKPWQYKVAHRGKGLWRTWLKNRLKYKHLETCSKQWSINHVRFWSLEKAVKTIIKMAKSLSPWRVK